MFLVFLPPQQWVFINQGEKLRVQLWELCKLASGTASHETLLFLPQMIVRKGKTFCWTSLRFTALLRQVEHSPGMD